MKVVFTSAADADLDDVLTYTAQNHPSVRLPLEQRIRAVLVRIEQWPESAREVDQQPGTRIVPLIRYPYKIFYRIVGDRIEILHIHHAARDTVEEW
jgi:plasmid stabilization system protein ParE